MATAGKIASRLRLHCVVRAGRTEATLGAGKSVRLVVVSSRSGRVSGEREEPALIPQPEAKK